MIISCTSSLLLEPSSISFRGEIKNREIKIKTMLAVHTFVLLAVSLCVILTEWHLSLTQASLNKATQKS